MNFSRSDFVTPNDVLSDVLKIVDDENYNLLTKGWYTSQMQQALQELAYDTFFDDRITSLPVPQNLRVDMPEGSFNIREIWLYNGTECNFANAKNVYWKRNYFTRGNGYVANDRWSNNGDPFYKDRSDRTKNADNQTNGGIVSTMPGSLFFYNIVEGVIMLSPNSRGYQNLLIKYNGTGCAIGDTPVIPGFLRQAVKCYVADKALEIRKNKAKDMFEFNKWSSAYNTNKINLDGRTNRMYDGAWYEAQARVKSMDSKARSDLKEYNSKLNK